MAAVAPARPAGGFARPLPATCRALKRIGDVALAAVLLVLAAPLLLVVAPIIVLTSPGPVLFRQERVGAGGRRFQILKLRTMVPDAEQLLARDPVLHQAYLDGHFKLPSELDPRVTPFGRFLRRTSLDEVPQLVNVLLGHMSMVGPRPVVPEEIGLYGDLAPLYHRVRPGITGYWQVQGRSLVSGPDRIELEGYYLRNPSFRLDAVILLRTVPAVLCCRGAR